VIDRIAYSPYGEATRTLRSDVNGDGFVNQSDYSGVIRPRNGATIGTASYVVEADLDRNGVINQIDYDISIADDGKSSSGGVGEAGLFSRGVRNSIGYCGYIFNEDSGLYTVRFRTYSPTLGRWLERDPAGYVDGANTYAYLNSGPIGSVDPTGLFDAAAHYYGTYIAAICAGRGVDEAMSLAYYAQYPDQVHRFDALSLFKAWSGRRAMVAFAGDGRIGALLRAWDSSETAWMYKVMETLHTLRGGDPKLAQDCLRSLVVLLRKFGYSNEVVGTVVHAFGDAHAHFYLDDAGNQLLYTAPYGHGPDSAKSRLGFATCPDNACSNPHRVIGYVTDLCVTLGGTSAKCQMCVGQLARGVVALKDQRGLFGRGTKNDPDEYIEDFYGWAVNLGFPASGWKPGSYDTDPKRRPISPAEMDGIMNLIKCWCDSWNAGGRSSR
jgi:RHS repeat-associated protein